MRKLFISCTLFCLILLSVVSAAVRHAESNTTVQASNGRCTRLLYPKKKKSKEPPTIGGRCTRLNDKHGKAGKPLPNTAPTVTLGSSPDVFTLACANEAAPASCKPSTAVTLNGTATDADGDSLLYTFSTTGGRISGDGPSVSWDLSGVQPGTYTASVEVDDGCGCIAFTSTNVTVSECSGCNQ